MKTLVVPTDFSAHTQGAVNYAADMALAIHASVSLFHVCPLPVAYAEVPVPADVYTHLLEDAEKAMQQAKEQLAKQTSGRLTIYTKVETGNVVTQIQNYCSEVKPYAVVMSSRGAGGAERALFGSNTQSAIKHLSWPLIIVPADARFTNIKKVGLACDLKDVADTVPLREINLLVKEFGAELFVLHVNTEDRYASDIIEQSGMLTEMLNELRPSYHFLDKGDIDQGISEFAEKNHLDLLITIPKSHGLIGGIFHKSLAKQLALHTHIPIMSIHE